MKDKHPTKGLDCNICNYRATSSWQLNNHKNTVILGIKYLCTLCDYKGQGKSHLYMHMMRLHKGYYLKCNDCIHVADNYTQLKDHRKETHNNEQNSAKIFPISKQEIIIIYQEINVHKVTSVSFNNKLNF